MRCNWTERQDIGVADAKGILFTVFSMVNKTVPNFINNNNNNSTKQVN